MYDKRAERRAVCCGILDRMQSLENDLMQIDGICHVAFDIDNYGDPVFGRYREVIIVPKYAIDPAREDYFAARRQQLETILDVAARHDLTRTQDRIEDMGEHWYIVLSCGETWPR